MKWKKFIGVIAVVTLFTFIGGCGLTGSKDQKNLNQNQADVESQENSGTPSVNPQPTQEKVEVTLYFSDDQAMYLEPDQRTVEKGGRTLPEILVEELIKGPDTKDLHKTIPEGVKLLSLEVVDGVAFVNFSKEMQTNHWGGTTSERMTAQSVIQTLAQLPEIEKVQFLIEGQKKESIWGHGYTGEPLAPAKDIVSGE